jgi:hypothetical protein
VVGALLDSTSRRRVVAALTAVLAIGALAGIVPGTSATGGLPVRAGTVAGVTSTVNETTPLYHLTLTFDLTGVQCPAVLDYTIKGREYTGVSICSGNTFLPSTTATHQFPVFFLSSTLDPETSYPVTAFVRLAGTPFDRGVELGDQSQLPQPITTPKPPVWIGVGDGYTSQRNQENNDCFAMDYGPETRGGMAICDLFDADGNPGTDGAPDSATMRNDAGVSWVQSAAQDFNATFAFYFPDPAGTCETPDPVRGCVIRQNIPSFWGINSLVVDPNTNEPDADRAVVARDTATAESLASDDDAQIVEMKRLLSEHAGSWNWVGLSAGLVDSGIQDAIWGAYPGDGTADGYDPTGAVNLWDVSTVGECPDLSGVEAQVGSRAGLIQAGIENVIQEARASSPGVRTVVTRYPYLTEVTSTGYRAGRPNPCAGDGDNDGVADNREGINALNQVIDGVLEGYAPPVGVPPTVFTSDLNAVFGAEPTGTKLHEPGPGEDPWTDDVYAENRVFESYLQLTRPWGYPYPSALGLSAMSSAAVQAALDSGDKTPSLKVTVVKPDGTPASAVTDDNGAAWYHHPGLLVRFAVQDQGNGLTWVQKVCWEGRAASPPDGIGIVAGCTQGAEGAQFVDVPLLEAKDLTYSGTAIDSDESTAELSKDFTLDLTGPVLTAAVVGGLGDNGWYKDGAVVVDWSMDDGLPPTTGAPEDRSGPDLSTLTVNSVTSTTPGAAWELTGTATTITSSGTYTIVASGQDNVGNPGTATKVVKVDFDDPTFVDVTASPTSGWTNSDVEVTWTFTDHVSGFPGGPSTSRSATATVEGEYTVPGPTVRDQAGNETTGPGQPVKIDKTAPDVVILGIAEGDLFEIGDLPEVTCGATDALSGLDGSCSLGSPSVELVEVDGHWVSKYSYAASARDLAGNVGTTTVNIYVSRTPALTASVVRASDGIAVAPGPEGWYRDSGLVVRFSVSQEGDGPTTVSQVCSEDRTGETPSLPSVCLTGSASSLDIPLIEARDLTYTGTVTDRNGSVDGTIVVSFDQTVPTVAVTFSAEVYDHPAVPQVTGCTIDDQAWLSGPAPATCLVSDPQIGPFVNVDGLIGRWYTYTATGRDVAGNAGSTVATRFVKGFPPVLDGRMTLGGTYGPNNLKVSTAGTLRCSGSPNKLLVTWKGGWLKVDRIDSLTCWLDPALNQAQPKAKFNTMAGSASGVLHDGTRATIDFTFADAGEPGTNDKANVVVKRGVTVVHASTGKLTSGNYQAHLSQGNGTNNSGCLNGPNGRNQDDDCDDDREDDRDDGSFGSVSHRTSKGWADVSFDPDDRSKVKSVRFQVRQTGSSKWSDVETTSKTSYSCRIQTDRYGKNRAEVRAVVVDRSGKQHYSEVRQLT